MKEYTVLKLINGYDIICTYSKEKSTEITIEVIDPMLIISSITKDGVSIVYLKRYNTLAESDHMGIRKSQVISSYAPRKELVRYYNVMLKYYKEEVDDTLAKQLDMTTTMFESKLKEVDTAFGNDLDTVLDGLLQEYEKELVKPTQKKTKKSGMH